MKNLAAIIWQGRVLIARFGNWQWLNPLPSETARWIVNERGGKRVTQEQIERACLENHELIMSSHFSDDGLMKEYLGQ